MNIDGFEDFEAVNCRNLTKTGLGKYCSTTWSKQWCEKSSGIPRGSISLKSSLFCPRV